MFAFTAGRDRRPTASRARGARHGAEGGGPVRLASPQSVSRCRARSPDGSVDLELASWPMFDARGHRAASCARPRLRHHPICLIWSPLELVADTRPRRRVDIRDTLACEVSKVISELRTPSDSSRAPAVNMVFERNGLEGTLES